MTDLLSTEFMHSFDARDWAKAFVEHVRADSGIAFDESAMIGWFANAIMRGYEEGIAERRRIQFQYNAALEELEELRGTAKRLNDECNRLNRECNELYGRLEAQNAKPQA
jgi:hypothetical protein